MKHESKPRINPSRSTQPLTGYSVTPQPPREIVDALISILEEAIEDFGTVTNCAIVANTTTGNISLEQLSTGTPENLRLTIGALRQVSHRLHADFIMTVRNVWGIHPDMRNKVRKIIAQYGSIAASPYRMSSLLLTVETSDGSWYAQADIQSQGHNTKKHYLGPVRYLSGTVEGGFANLLASNGMHVFTH